MKKQCSEKIKIAISSEKVLEYRKYLCNLKLEKDHFLLEKPTNFGNPRERLNKFIDWDTIK